MLASTSPEVHVKKVAQQQQQWQSRMSTFTGGL
jgi:hypothetical protein